MSCSTTDQLLVDWLTIISSELIFIPLVAGLAFGLLVSLFPPIKRRKRATDRTFYVYLSNAIGSGGAFMLINQDAIYAALSMLILVIASSILIPWVYFNVLKK